MLGILGFGAYVPRLRLQRAAIVQATAWFNPALSALSGGERALCSVDEDTITMAAEAARDCLHERDRAEIGKLILASTTLPFADRQNAGILKEALNLRDTVTTLDVTGSQRAGSSALIAALEGAGTSPTLCVASERRQALPGSELELVDGHGAAAALVGEGDTIADFIGFHSVSVDFVDHFRASDHAHAFGWESRWVRDKGFSEIAVDAVRDALERLSIDARDVDHFVMPAPIPGVHAATAKAAGVRGEAVCDPLSSVLGDAGAAQPLLLLASALERAAPGETIVLVGFGQGCDVLAFRTTPHIALARRNLGVVGWLKRRRPEDNYIKHLYWGGELKLDGGIRSEFDTKTPLSLAYRDRKTLLALVGGRCRETGEIQFPKSRVSVSQSARMVDTQDDYPLADRAARVLTYTADRLGFSSNPPNCYGMVEFEGGGRLIADFADVEGEELRVGSPVRMMFRLKHADQRGYRHYFWKAVPDFRAD